MRNKKNIVAIIPARGGSKGIRGKNLKLLAGKPLIAYTIEAAKGCGLVDRVIVTTDDAKIAKVAKKFGAEVPFMRPKKLAEDTTPTEPVLKHAVEWLENNEGYSADIVLFLQPTDVFRRRYMVREVIEKILEDDGIDSVFVVTKTHKNFWRKKDNNLVRLAPDIAYGPRQKRELLYREDTGLACATRARFIKENRRIGDRVAIVINDEKLPFIDIHDELDFWMADEIIKKKHLKPNE